MSRFQFVADHRDTFKVKQLCETVEINRSSFYAWEQAAVGRAERAAADAALVERIRSVHGEDKTYGAPRVTADLNDNAKPEDKINHKRVARVMKTNGIAGVKLRRRVKTTISEPSDQKVPDLLKRDFTAPAPNLKYVGDITYLPLANGKNLYLATVIDCYSRRLAGWAVADHMRTDLIQTALKNAQATRGSLAGAVFHRLNLVSTHPRTSPSSAPGSASPSPWEPSGRARTTQWRSRSTPPSNASSCKAPPAGQTSSPAAERSSDGPPATTPADATPGAASSPRTPTNSSTRLRSRKPPNQSPRVSKIWGQGPSAQQQPPSHFAAYLAAGRRGARGHLPSRWRSAGRHGLGTPQELPPPTTLQLRSGLPVSPAGLSKQPVISPLARLCCGGL